MQTYRVEMTLTEDSTLTLINLPFHAGEKVEVVIVTRTAVTASPKRYPLRGTPVNYLAPMESVAESDWESGR